MNDIRKCICGYENKSKEDEKFIPVIFELSQMRFGGPSVIADAYACPKCKQLQLS